MKATLLLKKKTQQQIQTKYGEKTKYSLLCQGQRGDQWVGMWDGPEVRSMKEGSQITIELEQNGKYWNGKPIRPDHSQILTEINGKLDEVLSILSARQLNDELPKVTKEQPEDSGVPF